MQIKNTKTTYGAVAKIFHWSIFILIALLLYIGFTMEDIPNMADKFRVYGIHKSTGIVVLILACLRLFWKHMNVAPVLPASLHKLEKMLAHVGHGVLYFLMIAMPLSGWLMSSAAGFTVSVYGLFSLPNLVAPDKSLKGDFKEIHEMLAWVIIAMVVLHVLAALLHHFHYKNNILRRMLPFTGDNNDANDAEDSSNTMAGC